MNSRSGRIRIPDIGYQIPISESWLCKKSEILNIHYMAIYQGWRTFSASRANIQTFECTKYLACQDKKIKSIGLYLIVYNITFLYRLFCFTFSLMGQQSKCPIDLDRSVNGATQFFNRGSRGISLSGVWGGAPVANGFWKIFDRMELVFINCLPCQEDCTRFWII